MGGALHHGPRLILPSGILKNGTRVPLQALVDSGSEQNLISPEVVKNLNLPVEPLIVPLKVSALDGSAPANISQLTLPLDFGVSGNHHFIPCFSGS